MSLIWGAAAIGELIGRDAKFVYNLQYAGRLKSIRKVGRLLVADPDVLLQEIAGTPQQLGAHDASATLLADQARRPATTITQDE